MIETNLLPDNLKREFEANNKSRRIAVLAVMVITCVSLFAIVVKNFESTTAAEINSLENEILGVKLLPNNKELTSKQNKIESLTGLADELQLVQADQNKVGPFLMEIFGEIPEGIILDSFVLSLDERKATFTGRAPSRDQLISFIDGLNDLDSIAKVDNPLSNLVNQENIDFEISALINPAAIK